MEFTSKAPSPSVRNSWSNRRIRISAATLELEKIYPTNLTFYLDPPTDSISLKEFEEYAVARLTLLRAIERINLTSNVKYSNEWKTAVTSELVKLNLNRFLVVTTNGGYGIVTEDERRNLQETICLCRKYDCISHFILRLAYCRSEDLCRWFVSMELDFFRLKFMYVSSDKDRQKFLELYNLKFDKVDGVKLKEVQHGITTSNPNLIKKTIMDMDHYRVPFQYVLDLVRTRRVFLKGGVAYVPYCDIVIIVASQFRKSLSYCLALTKKVIPDIEQDERLTRILTDFDQRYTGKSYDTKKDKENCISYQDLPNKSSNSFPLCMKELYDVVEKDHHLKHFGRLQLGLFLKGVGLPIEDATKFWRTNFTKKAGMDGNRFDKQYLYNIRHMYGKEGKRADYTPYSCMKIITSSVGSGDHHGCPFRHSDATPLRSRLVAAKISDKGITEILKLVNDKHYQIACQKYFEYTHSSATIEGGVQHPNQYYEESENANLGRSRKARLSVATTRVSVYASGSSKSAVSKIDDVTSTFNEEEEDQETEFALVMAMKEAEARLEKHEEINSGDMDPTTLGNASHKNMKSISVTEKTVCTNDEKPEGAETPMEVETEN